MKRYFMISLLLLLAVAFLATGVYAEDATNVKVARDVNYVNAIADAVTGYCARVDSKGRLNTKELGGHTIASQWGSGLVYTGACVVHQVLVQGQTADDYAAVYDAVSATGTAKADPQSATAKQVANADLKGSTFATGIYVYCPNASVLVTVVYDPI